MVMTADFGPAELRAARLEMGLKQADLADLLGVAPNTLARWEQGTMTISQPRMLELAIAALRAQAS